MKNNPKRHKQLSEAAKECWRTNPNIRKAVSQGLRRKWKDPLFRKKQTTPQSEGGIIRSLPKSTEPKDRKRFWSLVEKQTVCWTWKGDVINSGYGLFHSYYFPEGLVHRIAWFLKYGPPPKTLQVCHKCDNRLCVRPSHLFLGTQQDNEDDKKRKGRTAKGANSPRKLYPERYAHLAGKGHWMHKHPDWPRWGKKN